MTPRNAASQNVPIVIIENAMPVWRDIVGETNEFVPAQNLFFPCERLKTGKSKECFTTDR
jgi:hypothetical protein